jgi:hypothetical protein
VCIDAAREIEANLRRRSHLECKLYARQRYLVAPNATGRPIVLREPVALPPRARITSRWGRSIARCPSCSS